MTSFLSRYNALHKEAATITGLEDFGSDDYVEPMKTLFKDYDRGYFSETGAEMVKGGIVLLLISRLFAQKGFTEHPELAGATIEIPLIIVGLPRTGSTSLHRFLAQDPANQVMVPWVGNTPMPRPPRNTWEKNPWFQMTNQAFEEFYKLSPISKAVHPQAADQADECRYGIEPCFWSPALAFMGAFHEYAEWMVKADKTYAYQHFRKVLGLIAGGDNRRWLLKDPTTHPWAFQTLLETFPDARFVYTHRDPVTAITSATNMLYNARRSREPDLRPEQNGHQQLALWAPAIDRQNQLLSGLDRTRVCHVHNRELNDDPLATAQRIYEYFDLPISEEARRSWQAFVDADPRGGHGAHNYTVEEVGLTPTQILDALGSYSVTYRELYGPTDR